MLADSMQTAALICVAQEMLESTVRNENQGEPFPKVEVAHIAADGMCDNPAGGPQRSELGPQQPEHLSRALYADYRLAVFCYRYQDTPAATPQLEDGRTSLLGGEKIEVEVAVDPGEVLVVVLRLWAGVFFDGLADPYSRSSTTDFSSRSSVAVASIFCCAKSLSGRS